MEKNLAQVRVEKIVNGGQGLSRLIDGRICLIPGVLAGELIGARIGDTHRGMLQATAEQILEPSPARISPPCALADTCGGCDLQHCSYPEQLQIKKEILCDLFSRSASPAVQQATTEIREPLPAPSPFHYRQRIRLQIDDRGRPCFRKRSSHDTVPVSNCLLAAGQLNRTLGGLMASQAMQALLSTCNELELLLNPGTGQVIAILHLNRPPRPRDFALARELIASETQPLLEDLLFCGETFALIRADQDMTPTTLALQLPPLTGFTTHPLTLSWEAGGFCQVNLTQNVQLIRTVLTLGQISSTDTVLDLFCGMGNFAIPLAGRAREVLGIEGQGAAIRSARKNATGAGLANTTFIKGPIHDSCRELITSNQCFDLVLIDPPRAGIPGLAKDLAFLTRRKLIYISCDPATLCRDLAQLFSQGFTIRVVQPVDMFPQTHHLETVVLLERH